MKHAVALAVFIMLLPMYGQEKGVQTTSHANSASELKQPAPKPQPASPPYINLVDQRTANQKDNKTKEQPESYLSRLFSPENLPNVGLFIAGVAGIIVAIRTLKAIRRQGLSMRRQTTHLRNSVAQARKAADAARRSADAYEKATRLTERADVLLESAGIILSETTGVFDGHARVVLRFKNFGRTRARDVSFRARLIIPEVPEAHILELPLMVLGADQGQSVFFQPFSTFLNKPTFDGIARGDIEMRFESWTIYADVFDASYTTTDVGIFNSNTITFRIEERIAC